MVNIIAIKDLERAVVLHRSELDAVSGGLFLAGVKVKPRTPGIFDESFQGYIDDWLKRIRHNVQHNPAKKDPYAPGGPLQGPF